MKLAERLNNFLTIKNNINDDLCLSWKKIVYDLFPSLLLIEKNPQILEGRLKLIVFLLWRVEFQIYLNFLLKQKGSLLWKIGRKCWEQKKLFKLLLRTLFLECLILVWNTGSLFRCRMLIVRYWSNRRISMLGGQKLVPSSDFVPSTHSSVFPFAINWV